MIMDKIVLFLYVSIFYRIRQPHTSIFATVVIEIDTCVNIKILFMYMDKMIV